MEEIFKRYKKYKIYIEGKSEDSVSQYYYRFKEFANDENLHTEEDILKVTADTVKKWIVKIAEKGNVEKTRNIKLSTIKELYRFLKEEDGKNIDEKILKIPFAKVPKKEKKYIDKKDWDDFRNSITNLLVKTATAICVETGVRFCELTQITVDGIMDGKQIVVGKGNKEREIQFKPYVRTIAEKYIKKSRPQNTNSNILLLTKKGEPLTENSFLYSLKAAGRKFNENPLTKGRMPWWKELSPHKLRHTFASIRFTEGYSAVAIQNAMGHSNMATTSLYSHASREQVNNVMLGINDNNNFDPKTIIKELLKYINSETIQKILQEIKEEEGNE